MSKAFHFTPQVIDDMSLEMLFDYIIVHDLEENGKPKGRFIDEIF